MPKYEITYSYTVYGTVHTEAQDREEAEAKFWEDKLEDNKEDFGGDRKVEVITHK